MNEHIPLRHESISSMYERIDCNDVLHKSTYFALTVSDEHVLNLQTEDEVSLTRRVDGWHAPHLLVDALSCQHHAHLLNAPLVRAAT